MKREIPLKFILTIDKSKISVPTETDDGSKTKQWTSNREY